VLDDDPRVDDRAGVVVDERLVDVGGDVAAGPLETGR
jgi:hypothetical protein